MKELVSIVVPVYNAEKYIANCINALINQKYVNLEIILVNDGSKDESINICNGYAKLDKRIQVIQKENGGVSSARNVGIDQATGKYIMFADSDDLPDKMWVERMVELLETWNVEMVICHYRYAVNYHEAKLPIDNIKGYEPVLALNRSEFLFSFAHMMTYNDTLFCPWNKIFLLDIVKKNKIKFPEELKYGEDFIFNILYLEQCNKIIETKEKLYNYITQNPESLEAKYKPDLYENQTLLYKTAKNFLIRNNAYRGYNVTNLAYYHINRTIAAIKNLFHEENRETDIVKRNTVVSYINNEDMIESVFLIDLHENREQSIITDLVKAKHYDDIYDTFYDIYVKTTNRVSDIRYKNIEEQPSGIKWIPYTFKSIKKYGVVITMKRIIGKIIRKFRG